MPAANPLADTVLYNTGRTGGMMSGTTQTFASGQSSAAAPVVAGNANITVGMLVGASLVVLVALHLLGFRFAFDVSVGRKG